MSTKHSGNGAELLLWGHPSAFPLKVSRFGATALLILTLVYSLNRPQRAAWCSTVGEGQMTFFTCYPSLWGPNYSGLVRQIYAEPNSAGLYILIQ